MLLTLTAFLLLALLIALWLWHPLYAIHRRYFVLAVGITTFLTALPVLLIWAARSSMLSYTTIAYLQVPSGGLFASIIATGLLALPRDGLALLYKHWGRPAIAQRLWQPRYTVFTLGLMLFLCGYGALQGLRPPDVHEYSLHLPHLPPELEGLRIAVIADLHASPINNAGYVREVVNRVNAAQPDMVVLPGDLTDGDAASQAPNIAPLADLRAPYGVWAAPGNHEYYSSYDGWAKVYAQSGLHYLANQSHTLDIRGKRLTLSGVGDPAYTQNHSTGGVPPDILSVAQQARAQQSQFHILLGHQPKMARLYADAHSVNLQIAGHTHGGHILGFDQWVVAPANNGFVRGIYEVSDMTLFVSSGAGLWAGFTVRLGVPASIDVLTLHRSSEYDLPLIRNPSAARH